MDGSECPRFLEAQKASQIKLNLYILLYSPYTDPAEMDRGM